MTFEDNASAIDDSYPVHFNPANGGGPPSHSPGFSVYNGPRSGHWSVRDTVIGSAIDDSYPTVCQFPVTGYDVSGRVQPLNGDLILRLAKATEETAKARAEESEDAKRGGQEETAPDLPCAKPQSTPPGFFAPMLDRRGIRIKGKNGKDEIVKTPELNLKPTREDTQKDVQQKPEQAKSQTQSPLPPASIKPGKAASVVSHASNGSRQGVRIISRNGDEVFMQLPAFQLASNSERRTPIVTKETKDEERKTPPVKDSGVGKAQRDSNAAKAAEKLRQERSRQAQIDDQRAREAKLAADMMMSGALNPSKASSAGKATPVSLKNLAKDPGIGISGMFEGASQHPSAPSSKTSGQQSHVAASARSRSQGSRVVSVASSKTSTTTHQEAASTKPASQPSGKIPNKTSNSKHSSYVEPKDSAQHNAVESKATQHPPTVRSRQAKEATPAQSLHNSFAPSPAKSQSRSTTRSSHIYNPIYQATHSPRSSVPNQTIFAGEGWISPHPLSVAPTEFEQPPESAIQVPIHDGDGMQSGARTMTYEEWKNIQTNGAENRARRNWSRSSSSAQAYQPGSWGFRGAKEAEAVDSRNGKRSVEYRSPAVESVRSGATYEHGFDGVREDDGKVWLPMPWDG